MKKRLFSYLFFLVVLFLLAFLYGFSKTRNQAKELNVVEIEFKEGNNHFLTHGLVDNLLIQNGKPVKSQLKSSVNLYQLEQEVLRNPFVENATVYMLPSGVMKAEVKQREPVARIVTAKNSFYVDKYLVSFPLSANFSSRVPLVKGVKQFEDLKQVVTIMNYVLADNFLKKEVVAIDKNKGFFSLLVRSGDYRVVLGNSSNLDVKFKKLKAFYNKAFKDKTLNKYKVINVNYHNQVVCTK